MAMSFFKMLLFVTLVVGMPLGAASQEVKKEKPNLEFGKTQDLEMDLVNVPDSVGSGGKSAPVVDDNKATQEGRWLRIDVPFSTTNKFTPEVKFKFYLEGYEKMPPTDGGKGKEKFVILTGETTYRDVPAGKKHFAGVFLPPAAVMRFSAHKPNGEQDWKSAQMNLKIEGMDGGSPTEKSFDLQGEKEFGLSGRGGKKDTEWNKSTDAQEISGALLPIYDTPFWPKDYKRYPQPKKP
jgi:hypothetical protein